MKNKTKAPISKNGRFSAYQALLDSIQPRSMTKRAKYLHGIGVFHGLRGDTVWTKIRLTNGGIYKGKSYKPGQYVEVKLGNLPSYTWPQVEAKRLDLQGKADRGEALEAAILPTFGEYAQEWLEANRTRHRGFQTSAIIVNKALLPWFQHKPLDAITVRDINQWQTHQAKTLQPGTLKRQQGCLSAILNKAMKERLIGFNPCKDSNAIKVPEAQPVCLSDAELTTVLELASKADARLNQFLRLALLTGMRRGELLALTWDNIIAGTNGTSLISFVASKTQRHRAIVCDPEISACLSYFQALNALGTKNKSTKGPGKVIPYSLSTLRRMWEAVQSEAGFPVKLKFFRSTNATLSINAGIDIKTVAARLGHHPRVLVSNYAAVLQQSAIDASTAIGQRLAGLTAHQGTVSQLVAISAP